MNPDRKPLKADSSDIQPRYRVQVWMEAVDTDIETGKDVLKTPRGIEYRGNRGLSKEKLTFIVVPENELLSEIAKEEDGLYVKLAEQVNRLKDSLSKLDRMKEDLTGEGAEGAAVHRHDRPGRRAGLQPRQERVDRQRGRPPTTSASCASWSPTASRPP